MSAEMEGIPMLLRKDRFARKVALLKRVGLFDANDRSVVVRRAIVRDDLIRAYRLVHDVFVDKGYIDPGPNGIRIRLFEALPEMATFVAEADGQMVGVMSIVPDSPDMGLPADKCFKTELDRLRDAGRKVAEVTNLAVLSAYRRSNAFMELAKPVLAQALSAGCDDVFIAISPGHARFFQDVLQFEPWGERRSYSDEKMDIVEGKRWNLRTLERRLLDCDRLLGDDACLHEHFFPGNAYHQYVRPWALMAKRAFLDPDVLRALFVKRCHLLERCSPEQRLAISRRWGSTIFADVYHGETAELTLA